MGRVEQGLEPSINIFRNPLYNRCLELPNEGKGIALGLKSTRLGQARGGGNQGPAWQPQDQAMRRSVAEQPPWVNPEPWAGNGMRHWLREHGFAPKEPTEAR